MRTTAIMVVSSIASIFYAMYALLLVILKAKGLASRQGRREIAEEVQDAVSFMVSDQDFKKSFHSEFRGLYFILFSLVVVIIAGLLGIS